MRYSQHKGDGLIIRDEHEYNAYGSYASVEAFIKGFKITPTGAHQHLYEVLATDKPRYFGLDLDWDKAQHADEATVVKRHVAFVTAFVRKRYKLHDMEVKAEVCCATGDAPEKGYTK